MKKWLVGLALTVAVVIAGIMALSRQATSAGITRLNRAALTAVRGGVFRACNYSSNCTTSCEQNQGTWSPPYDIYTSRRNKFGIYYVCGNTILPTSCEDRNTVTCYRDYFNTSNCTGGIQTTQNLTRAACD